jgi:hypothetical protein
LPVSFHQCSIHTFIYCFSSTPGSFASIVPPVLHTHLHLLFLPVLRFPLPVSFHQCSIHTFIYCFSQYCGFLCQYRSTSAPYTPSSTVALTTTSVRSLGTFKSNAVYIIRTRFSELQWANTSAVGTASCYLTPINPNVDVSWLAFLFRIWWLSRNLTVAQLFSGHSRWCLHRSTDVYGSLCDGTSCNAVNGKCLLRTCLHPSSRQKGFPNVSTVPVCQTTRRLQPRSQWIS